ncbi:hypothetical protein AMATHDRAFT_76152 [Amanita thiersii Skay4041]|uniref:Meiotically up-regulated protein Msb1/Mug8 domain-containing protein n=1 Tax=Amanita thiersii Skay4041 TaxID=703135 RepID=A0A2A9NJP2_9AGAR|nr:hypothetical protein AMATHDRAFT_76152 [Amanita thiersii Skay4041]
MPSLFSRSRTHSTPQKKNSTTFLSPSETTLDEFGRSVSRASARDATASPTPSKKDKKKAKDRSQTLGNSKVSHDASRGTISPFPTLPEGSFLPLSLEPPLRENGQVRPGLQDYGFLAYQRHVVLGLSQLARLVDVVADELSTRGGITTPFIFSTTALDVSYSSIKRLIAAFLDTCEMRSSPSVEKAEAKWRDEARFAGLHELGMCLRWGLARVVRISRGMEVRGLIAWDHYVKFRDSEAALKYPPGHFQTFLQDLPPTLQSIVTTVLTLLIRLTANSTSSGHTPPSLSPLFGPLFFGLGPATLAFHHTYIHYLRSTNAMEHIILAFIRWQDTPRTGPSGSAAALGVPARLKDWIKGYPAMLPFLTDPKKDTVPQSRKGARTLRLLNVRRNVRMYSLDLVKTAATWGSRGTKPSASSLAPSNGLSASKEWERVAPMTLKLPPRYADSFRKRMNMPSNFHPECGPGYVTGGLNPVSSTSSYKSTVSSSHSGGSSEADYLGLNIGPREGEDRFKSLTDLKWGEFESMGFGGIGDEKKLEFDLTESARQERSAKRQTLSWNDFSAAGFSRNDGPLSATLQFSTPIANTISTWPSQNAEIHKKLKKAEKALPPFGWDTEPVVLNEEVIEEAFIDVFCDLVYGGGWMDNERVEEVDRDCNWALVEFKAMPPHKATAVGTGDPRTATILVLFEEFVPLEYRQKLAQSSTSRRRLPSFFSPKSKQWKQAATLNGRPYVVGHVPRSPSYREVEFEGLLREETPTKILSLTSPTPRVVSTISTALTDIPGSPTTAVPPPVPPLPEAIARPPKSDDSHNHGNTYDSTMTPSKRHSRFRLPGGIPVPSPGSKKSGLTPAQYSVVDFETRMASYSDDEFNNANESESIKQRRRQSKDDAWVDILVNSQGRRLGGQDAEHRGDRERRRGGLRGTHSDPDLASMEVAQVLAAVKNRSPSPPSMLDRVDRDFGMDQHVRDLDIDEIETVPRTSGSTTNGYTAEQEDEPEPAEEEEEEEEAEDPVQAARLRARQGRKGYFDLHPERRRAVPSMALEDEIRAKLANDSDEEEDDDEVYGQPTPTKTSVADEGGPYLAVNSEQSLLARRSGPELPVEEVQVPQQQQQYQQRQQPVANVNVNENGNGNGNGHHHVETKLAVPQTRTAALIEMYRERERTTSTPPINNTAPLRPVRPLPKEPGLPPSQIPVPVPAISITIPPAPTVPPPKPIEVTAAATKTTTYVELPQVKLQSADPELPTPVRYVHGAPLHNVLEEPEDEE